MSVYIYKNSESAIKMSRQTITLCVTRVWIGPTVNYKCFPSAFFALHNLTK